MVAVFTGADASVIITGVIAALAILVPVLVQVQRGKTAITDTQATVGAVVKQMEPNGGSTMRDAVDRIERGQVETHSRLGNVEALVVDLATRMSTVEDKQDTAARRRRRR